MSVSDVDPTGVLKTATAAVGLVGAVMKVAPVVKAAYNNHHSHSTSSYHGAGGGQDVTGASTRAPPPSLAAQSVDPERERRAYETVNFVLRTIGSRMLDAGLVNVQALAKALTAATEHIEVNLFSLETNRLFQSLAHKLDDVLLVNSVFSSIYFLGFIHAELEKSLPNWKPEYTPPLGPRLLLEIFKAAIGEHTLRENLRANLDAYSVLSTTAGLLRPTDINRSIFPDFPSFAPCRYSSKGFRDKNQNRNTFERLVRHFETFGFPQPLQGKDVGPIRDWRFLSGDRNSRNFEVEKADKHIGENFGRVIHWLICDAHRMPSGTAVIAYHDQHISLIKYLGTRFGYRVLNAQSDLNMSGSHLQMKRNLRSTFNTWVIVMPSEAEMKRRRESASQGNAGVFQGQQSFSQALSQARGIPTDAGQPRTDQHVRPSVTIPQVPSAPTLPSASAGNVVSATSSHARPSITESSVSALDIRSEGQAPPLPYPISHAPSSPKIAAQISGSPSAVSAQSSPSSKPQEYHAPKQRAASVPFPSASQSSSSSLNQIEVLDNLYRTTFVPMCLQFTSNPPHDPALLQADHTRLTEGLMTQIILRLDKLDTGDDGIVKTKKKGLIDEVLAMTQQLDQVYQEGKNVSSPPSRPSSTASFPPSKPVGVAPYQPPASISELDATSGPVPTELPASFAYQTPLPSVLQATYASVPQSPLSASTSSALAELAPTTGVTSPVSSPGQAELPAFPNAPLTAELSATSEATDKPPNRRKAPRPPRKAIAPVALAKALYDFEPENDEGEELAFSEGDTLEIMEKSKILEEDGWCKARIKGRQKIGLAPLEFIEELGPATAPASAPKPPRAPSATAYEQASANEKPPIQEPAADTAANPEQTPSASSMGPPPFVQPESEHTAAPSKISDVNPTASPASSSGPFPPPSNPTASSAQPHLEAASDYFTSASTSAPPYQPLSTPSSQPTPGQGQTPVPFTQPLAPDSSTPASPYHHHAHAPHAPHYPHAPHAPHAPHTHTFPNPSPQGNSPNSAPHNSGSPSYSSIPHRPSYPHNISQGSLNSPFNSPFNSSFNSPAAQPQPTAASPPTSSIGAGGIPSPQKSSLLSRLADPVAKLGSAAVSMYEKKHAADMKHSEWMATHGQVQQHGHGQGQMHGHNTHSTSPPHHHHNTGSQNANAAQQQAQGQDTYQDQGTGTAGFDPNSNSSMMSNDQTANNYNLNNSPTYSSGFGTSTIPGSYPSSNPNYGSTGSGYNTPPSSNSNTYPQSNPYNYPPPAQQPIYIDNSNSAGSTSDYASAIASALNPGSGSGSDGGDTTININSDPSTTTGTDTGTSPLASLLQPSDPTTSTGAGDGPGFTSPLSPLATTGGDPSATDSSGGGYFSPTDMTGATGGDSTVVSPLAGLVPSSTPPPITDPTMMGGGIDPTTMGGGVDPTMMGGGVDTTMTTMTTTTMTTTDVDTASVNGGGSMGGFDTGGSTFMTTDTTATESYDGAGYGSGSDSGGFQFGF